MANPKKDQPGSPAPNPKPKGNLSGGATVIDMASMRCKADGCNKKSSRADFCEEHFEWFKMGLITKEGKRAADFEKKFQQHINHQKKSA
jgi:hypothetical protein